MSNATVIQPARGSLAQQLMITISSAPSQERGKGARARTAAPAPLRSEVAVKGVGPATTGPVAARSALAESAPAVGVAAESPVTLGRQCLTAAIEAVKADAKVEFCPNWATANTLDASRVPDLVVVDLDTAGYADLQPMVEWRDRFPGIPLVVISSQCERGVVTATLAAGAHGYLPLTDDKAIAESALRLVLAGGRYLPPEWMGYVRKPVPTAVRRVVAPELDRAPSAEARSHTLTSRQLDVLRCLVEGKSNKEIARGLGLGVGTVKCHLQAIYRTLDVENRTRAVVVARRVLSETE